MSRGRRSLPSADVLAAGGLLALLATLFWKFRIFDRGTDPTIGIGPVDLYVEIIPTLEYGYSMLRAWHFPLWNPYQFCGEPFFAIGWTGLLYPPHWIRLFVDIPLSVEIMLIFHLFWAGFGMWLLARHFGIGTIGALCAAMTFAWSGWMTLNNTLPGVVEGLSWTPFIVLLLDHMALGRRFAWFWLIAAITCQLMLGVTEIFVHTVYIAAIFFSCRLLQLAWQGQATAALRRALLAMLCVATAILLALPLLLPTFELAQQSTRASGKLSLAQVLGWNGTIAPLPFLRSALAGDGIVTVGVLPVLALPLALSLPHRHLVAIASASAAILGALMVFGGPVFTLYYHLPVVGSLFRRPMKFLDVYTFGQALLAGLAVTRLGEWSAASTWALWRSPAWLTALALGVAGLLWLAHLGTWNGYLAGALGLMFLIAVVPRTSFRNALLVGLCAIQGASLFFMVGDTHVRPVKRPEIFHHQDFILNWLQQSLGDGRVYLTPAFLFDPALTAKQGQLRRMAVSTDYEPLATSRYAAFFDRITPRTDPAPFAGTYFLNATSRWHLMDLTSTKFFIAARGDEAANYMDHHPADFRFAIGSGNARVFERREVLPRAYFVTRSRTITDPDVVLATLDDPSFDPRAEVLLEEPVASEVGSENAGTAAGNVTTVSYEPDRVALTVRADRPGFVVLGDLHYPGWKAYLDEHEVPILRANYLFRAVQITAGSHQLHFEYRPASFRLGLLLSALTALAVGTVVAWSLKR